MAFSHVLTKQNTLELCSLHPSIHPIPSFHAFAKPPSHPLIHPFTQAFIQSVSQSFVHSCMHACFLSFFLYFFLSFVLSFSLSFFLSFITVLDSFTHSSMCSAMHPITHSFNLDNTSRILNWTLTQLPLHLVQELLLWLARPPILNTPYKGPEKMNKSNTEPRVSRVVFHIPLANISNIVSLQKLI